jgi:hypothetical protein
MDARIKSGHDGIGSIQQHTTRYGYPPCYGCPARFLRIDRMRSRSVPLMQKQPKIVMAGLDPAIHAATAPDGCPDQVRA